MNRSVISHRSVSCPLRVCHVAYAFYESDTRIRMYAEAQAARGDHVDVVSLRRPGQAKNDLIEGVHVHRIQERVVNEHTRTKYLFRILRFFAASAFFLAQRSFDASRRYDVLHIHSVPDFEVFAALVPKLRGAGIILDIHDLVPEFYAGKFGVSRSSVVFRALLLAEKVSASFADHVIIANHLWEETITQRAVSREKCSTFLNYPTPYFFRRYPRRRNDGKIRLIYPGTLNRHQGVDIAVRAFDLIRAKVPGAELHVYGEGPEKDTLKRLVAELGLDNQVFIRDALPLEEIIPAIAEADIGVVPKRAEGFGNTAFSTKILEFMALGLPVIVSRTAIDSHYFSEDIVRFFDPGDVRSLAEAMRELISDPRRRKELANRAAEFARENSWEIKKETYLRLTDRLAGCRCR